MHRPASLFGLFAALAPLAKPATAGPLVDVGYATYEGRKLTNGFNQFLGMRYAAPPLGEIRFKKPTSPLQETEVIQADKVGRRTTL